MTNDMTDKTHEELAEEYGLTLDEVKALDFVHYKFKLLNLTRDPLEVLVRAVHDPLRNLGLVVEFEQ
jgi:chromosome condensin MukBEF MukE localization factor